MKKKNSQLLPVVKRAVSQSRRDIADWRNAVTAARRADNPRFYQLQDIYQIITDDALLASQINNRHEPTVAHPFELVAGDGKVDDKLTAQLCSIPCFTDIIKEILNSELYGYSVLELASPDNFTVINRRNFDPENGLFFPDATSDKSVAYRRLNEYGRWILEFYSGGNGLLNKCVPHTLFKRFAQSCWSELCEIYGIPPRYVKTNTQDPEMLNRAQQMLQQMGAAAAFVIDTTEEFQFAQGVSTNGDVYNNLIRLCNNEISLLISGAIMGQDTANGNYSKEQASIGILNRLIASDQRMVEMYVNSIVLPAFMRLGWLPQKQVAFRFAATEDIAVLWQMVKDIIPYKDIDNKWLTEKFGLPVSDKFAAGDDNLSVFKKYLTADSDFFA